MKLNLNDIFYSVQGEGKYIGIPTLFFRFNKCNLNCDYCDTSFEKLVIEDVRTMAALVKNFFENYPIRHICFTGGEPLLFKEQINLILRIIYEKLNYNIFDIKIETSGLIKFPYIYPYRRRLIYTITPKFKYIDNYTPDNFRINCNEIIFKFMMELDEYEFSKQLDQILSFFTTNCFVHITNSIATFFNFFCCKLTCNVTSKSFT